MCHFKKGRNAQIKTLEKMWKNSNTEQFILEQIRDQFGEKAFKIAIKGQIALADGIWFLMLDHYDLTEFINETGKVFFEFGDIEVKVWENNSETLLEWIKSRRRLQQWLV